MVRLSLEAWEEQRGSRAVQDQAEGAGAGAPFPSVPGS